MIGLPHRLRSRLLLAMGGYSLLVAALFTLYALAFAYTVEDEFIERDIAAFVAALAAGEPAPRGAMPIEIYASIEAMPADLRRELQGEPHRREVPGDAGRHYHLQRFELHGQPRFAVAEVSAALVFRTMRATVVEILVWSAAGALLMALLIGALIAGATTRRLSRLADAMQTLDPAALPPGLPPSSARDEVAVVERGVDDLLRRMATYIEREQSFTRDASHELRGPLSVIRSAAEQLAADAQLPATAQRRAAAIAASAARLADTVQALLMLARQAHPPGGASPLLPAIEACVLDLSLDGERAIEIAIDVPEGARVAIDSAVLDVLLRNIIGNALTHATGAVRIAVVQDRCEISNRSPAPLRESDFDAFAKGERSAGVGLGLNIVKRLDERYRLGLRFRYDPAEQTVVVAIPLLPAG